MKIPLKKINSIFEYTFLALLVLSMRTVFVHLLTNRLDISLIKILIVVNVLFLLVFGFRKLTIEKNILVSLAIYYSLAILLFGYNLSIIEDGIKSFVFDLFILLPLFILLLRGYYIENRLENLLSKYTDIVFFIAVISLFFWLLGSIFQILLPNVTVLSTWADIKGRPTNGYSYLYFETQRINLLGFTGWRNTAIFTEGPMYNIILVLAYIQILFLEKRRRLLRELIILFAIISTLSTTGFFAVALVHIYKIYFKGKLTSKKILFLITLSPIFLISIVFFLYSLATEKLQTGSSAMRLDDVSAGFMAWKNNLLMGNGYTHLEAIFPYMNMSFRFNTGYSNGIMSILVQGGIILFIIYFLPMIFIFFSKYFSRDIKFLIILWLFLIFNTIIDTTPLFLFITSLGYVICFMKMDNKEQL
ncbi:TPA: O-antigen ligase family protein [Streptococcus suis]